MWNFLHILPFFYCSIISTVCYWPCVRKALVPKPMHLSLPVLFFLVAQELSTQFTKYNHHNEIWWILTTSSTHTHTNKWKLYTWICPETSSIAKTHFWPQKQLIGYVGFQEKFNAPPTQTNQSKPSLRSLTHLQLKKRLDTRSKIDWT